MIISAEKYFWINHVEKRNPPKLDASFGAERGAIENFLVCWKSVLSNRVDSKALKAKYPGQLRMENY